MNRSLWTCQPAHRTLQTYRLKFSYDSPVKGVHTYIMILHKKWFQVTGYLSLYHMQKGSTKKRWIMKFQSLTFMTNSPIFKFDKISLTILTHSASGTMTSYCPAMSKSCAIIKMHSCRINDKSTYLCTRVQHADIFATCVWLNENQILVWFIAYALIELAVAASTHCRIIATINFSNVIAFDGLYFIHSDIASKWNLNESVKGL